MATLNPFDLLGDDDTEDPALLVAKVPVATKKAPAAAPAPAAKLPSKPLPPAQAVRESRGEGGRGNGRGGGRGYGRGRGRGYDRDNVNADNAYGSYGNKEISGGQGGGPDDGKFSERREGYGGPRGSFRGGGGGRRGGFNNGEMGEERPRRVFDRRSGTGRGNDFKREGAGQGNWGTATDELAQTTEVVNEDDKNPNAEKSPSKEEETVGDDKKDAPATEPEEKEPEDKEMTLEEYEKVLEEKRKALLAHKAEERKVDAKPFETMQPLASKKENHDVFVKLRADKDKKKDLSEKEDKAKKSLSINEFLKPAEGEKYNPGGRGRGRGRGPRGGYNGGGGSSYGRVAAPSIEDQGQFPTLGAK